MGLSTTVFVSVGLSAGLLKTLWMDLHKHFIKDKGHGDR